MGKVTTAVIKWTGSTAGIMTAAALMVVWGIYGYLAHYFWILKWY